MTPQLKKNWLFLKKNDLGVSFLLVTHEEKWPPKKNDPYLKIEKGVEKITWTLKKPLSTSTEICRTQGLILSLSYSWFCALPQFSRWVQRGFIYLSFVKVNKYSIQCSDALLDHTDHWIILFIDDIYCCFVPFLSKKCVFWRIWSKAIGFVVIRVIQCIMLTISSVPIMVIYKHVLNYAYRLLCI